MFNGLDEVDWKSLGHHVYGRHEQIPQEIRNLLSEDDDVREQARGFLLGEGQDFGDIYDTTPRIVPFLFEVLENPGAPDRDKLLSHLSGVAEQSSHPANPSIALLRLCLQTYDAFKVRLDTLMALLNDPKPEVRWADAELLGLMVDEVEIVIPALMQRFQAEPEENTQIALLKALKCLLHSFEWPRFALQDQFAPFFKAIVEGDASTPVRLAAAHASVELVGWPKGRDARVSSAVPRLLSEEFINALIEHDWHKPGVRFYETEEMAKDLSKLMDREVLLALMQKPELSAEKAHLVARAMLLVIFVPASEVDSHWQHLPERDPSIESLIYLQHLDAVDYLRPQITYNARRPMLQALLDAEKVWEIPTNLFSFFYGLPDTREGLRVLLEQLDAQAQER